MKTEPGIVPCSNSSSSRTSRKVAWSRLCSASAGSTSRTSLRAALSRSRKLAIQVKSYPGGRLFPTSPPSGQAPGSEDQNGRQKGDAVDLIGIDIGGTGIKGAPVDVERGVLAAERFRLLTPQPATPAAVAETVAEVVKHHDAVTGRVGGTFPAVIQHGVALTAANVDKSWIGTDVRATLERATSRPFTVLNDADAAGLAEMRF